MLKGKNVVVTGASRGLGRAIAWEAAKNNARVGINYFKSRTQARELAEQITAAGFPEPMLLPFDATQPADIQKGLDEFLAAFGRLDCWVNNAAVHYAGLLPILSDEEIRSQIDSALLGPVFCCRAVIPHLLQNKNASIVNVGSTVTQKTFRGQSVYSAAKGGLVSFSRALAYEYGRKGIRVNCIQPGPLDTDMLAPVKALAEEATRKQLARAEYCSPADVAALVVFLLSDRALSLTGACLTIDGGYTLT